MEAHVLLTSEQSKTRVTWLVTLAGLFASVGLLSLLAFRDGPEIGAPISQWIPVLGLIMISILFLVSSVAGLYSRKLAFRILFVPASLILVCVLLFIIEARKPVPPEPDVSYLNLWLVFTFCALILCSFWFLTSRLGWQSVSKRLTMPSKVLVAGGSLITILLLSTVFDLYSFRGKGYECHVSPPVVTSSPVPGKAVFTARVLWDGLLIPSRGQLERNPGSPRKLLALATVEDHFWGLSWWNRRLVILTEFQRGPSVFLR